MRFKGREKAWPFSVFLRWRSDSSDFQVLEKPLRRVTASVTPGVLTSWVLVNRAPQYSPQCCFKDFNIGLAVSVSFAACGIFTVAQSAGSVAVAKGLVAPPHMGS